ncbi:hypothetical protein LUZ60_013257 [Juncus effusus]|nr:hypothetical protein LUZ60_013257 [Juncus effusus]
MDIDASEPAGPNSTDPVQMETETNSQSTSDSKSKEKDQITESINNLNIAEPSSTFKRKPVIVIVVGMAGTGKTTLMSRLISHAQSTHKRGYVINLDPAVMTLPFGANIDIRDTIKYKEVMKEHNLGPNGAIMTSLNLFSTKVHEVVQIVENRAEQLDYVLVDTPGQIEIFTWSASGAIITEYFASTFPTVVAFVVDTPRSANPITFMSNMLFACGILYKTRLPLILAFNKVDVAKHEFALEWMEDFEAYLAAVDSDSSYASTLARSKALALDEFYKNIKSVGVSAVSGEGMNSFFEAVEASAVEYMDTYKAELDMRRTEKERLEGERRKESMERLKKEMEKSKGDTVVLSTGLKNKEGSRMGESSRRSMMDEDEEDEEEEEDYDVVFDEDEEEEEGENEEEYRFGF